MLTLQRESMSSLIQTVANDLIQHIKDDTLILPSLPEVCLRVRDVAEDVNTTIPQLAQLISQDAGLSARIIKVSNTPPYAHLIFRHRPKCRHWSVGH
jgi:HD-like signal output (HDOD) protein